ncbi:putative polysaccharide biosynthesis protein [Clostridium massiliamazoniense]|uniref:putative polysaccharide biosynthesis protein n=1 Tax=Clostridium massiliamazoniense TaxID=1347366 RepID=UPI0018D13940|nr:polysaccharide biosynthesis protein [Clostridium massiliamazoniense]
MKNSSRGVMILTFTNICSKLLSLVYIPLLNHNIGNTGYGVYGSAYSIYTFVYMVTIAGASTAIPKLISEYMETDHERDAMASFKIGRIILIAMGLIMTILLFVLSRQAAAFGGYESAYLAIIVLCPSIFLTALGSSYRGYFQGRSNLIPLGISQFIEQVLNVIFSVFFSFILVKYSVTLGVAGGAAGTAIGALVSLIYLKYKFIKDQKIERDKTKPRMHSNKYIFNYIIKFSIPLIISTGCIYAGNNLLDLNFITTGLQKAGFSEAANQATYGYFNKYMQLINTPMILISSLAISILPLIARANVSGDRKNLQNSIQDLIKVGFLIGMPAAIGLSVLSKDVFTMILGPHNTGGASIMKYGAYVFIFSSVYQLTNTMLNSLGKVKEGAINSLIGVAIKLICDYLLIPIVCINIYGVIIGLLISNIVTLILNVFVIERHIGKRGLLYTSWQKPAISAIIMGIVVFFVDKIFLIFFSLFLWIYIANLIALLISVYVGALVYVQAMVRLKGVDQALLNAVPRKFKKVLLLK